MTYKVVHCIVKKDELSTAPTIDEQVLETIAAGGLIAIISDTHKERLRPSRKNLLFHQKVNEQVMQQVSAILPMQFGIIADDVDIFVQEVLIGESMDLYVWLERLRNKHEVTLRAVWEQNTLMALAREAAPELARQNVESMDMNARIELGKRVFETISDIHDDLTRAVLSALEPYYIEAQLNERQINTESFNVSFLVDNDKQQSFEAALEAISVPYAEQVTFKLVTPLPPYSFVDMQIEVAKR